MNMKSCIIITRKQLGISCSLVFEISYKKKEEVHNYMFFGHDPLNCLYWSSCVRVCMRARMCVCVFQLLSSVTFFQPSEPPLVFLVRQIW